jgi:hypothetical protein
MTQFVLFELGYWLIAEEGRFIWENIDNTWTRNEYRPNGAFGQHTQWAVQGFQRYSKLAHAVKENVASKEQRYLSRVLELADKPLEVSGDARYPVTEELNGVLNQATKKALQAWADGALRCPVVVLPSDENNIDSIFPNCDPNEKSYELRQIDHYMQWRAMPEDESIWVKMLHSAFAVGEIAGGTCGIFGGSALATATSPTGIGPVAGIGIIVVSSNTLSSGINDLAGVFTENRVGYGYGNFNILYSTATKCFGKPIGSIVYTVVDVFAGSKGVDLALDAVFKGTQTITRTMQIIRPASLKFPQLPSVIQKSYNVTFVLGVGKRILKGFVVVRDGSIWAVDLKGTWNDITEWFDRRK